MLHENIVTVIKQYEKLSLQLEETDFVGNKREEIAKRLGLSVQQADRYKAFFKLIPEIQNLFYKQQAGMSSLLKIAPLSFYEQKEIFDILSNALQNNLSLTRDFVIQTIDYYKNGFTSWKDIEPYCKTPIIPSKKNTLPPPPLKTNFDYGEIARLTGDEFEQWFADLLKASGFFYVRVTPHSYDGGKDISALKDGICYIFQCKKTKSVGIKAIQEIWFAKKDSDHVAVVVTNGTFSTWAKTLAQKKGILCWNRKDLIRMCLFASKRTN